LFIAPPLIKPKSKKKQRGYWMSIENRRKFFIEFAQEMGFDPFVPENWNNVTYAKIIEKKVNIRSPRMKLLTSFA
jgi:hypothetical protein